MDMNSTWNNMDDGIKVNNATFEYKSSINKSIIYSKKSTILQELRIWETKRKAQEHVKFIFNNPPAFFSCNDTPLVGKNMVYQI